MKAGSVLDLIGNTPVVRINRLFDPSLNVWIKLEKANPGGSIKDRIALSMIDEAEKNGMLKPGSIIIEPTSGNTGIGLAMVAAISIAGPPACPQLNAPRLRPCNLPQKQPSMV